MLTPKREPGGSRACRYSAGLLVLLLGGCASLGENLAYYWQSARGHMSLMAQAEPVSLWLEQSTLSPTLRERLQVSQRVRDFAVTQLQLPDNGSYRSYVDLGRSAVVWNVFAAPPDQLKLQTWCFPVAGCVGYRGYFDEGDAKAYAARLAAQGLDVQVAPIPAYSTLGWFNDPLLNTFIQFPVPELARMMFHELAHQRVYIAGDSALNESFATAVEKLGLRAWLDFNANALWQQQAERLEHRREAFTRLLRRTRERLAAAYDAEITAAEKQAQKSLILDDFRTEYRQLTADWGASRLDDYWLSPSLGNAHFAAVGLYDEWVSAFLQLKSQHPRWEDFYQAVRSLGDLPPAEREQRLRLLREDAERAAGGFKTERLLPG